ncbi:UrcA family protein [Phenylobacterium hankyongense]|uniref:UrcA family protein n=1 Tax=Phenylobacterium hankyongense TaxID=1813876 RepID=A0A328AYT9_9CAUL|nr:UrcA family protein [Phenylobacterium hankyongense]RAK58846.1 UrcA family protein [Phenylobacterium hankyongense]
MSNFAARIAGLATLALAALPMVALTTAAHAAPIRVHVADLDLATAAGKATADRRIQSVANQMCSDERNLSVLARCRAAVVAEGRDKLVILQQARLAKASTFAAR